MDAKCWTGILFPRRSTLLCIQLCLMVLTSQVLGGQTERVWRRERGTRALKAGQHHRREGTALVAVMTGFDDKYKQRREHARATWFPSNEQEMQRMYEKTGMILRFAIGEVPAEHAAAVQQEEKEHGSFLRIPIEQDIYQRLTFKTVAFWELVSTLYNVNYVIKVDDDSYVRLDRLSIALSQWASMGADYIGCFKPRDNADNRLRLQNHRWYDPHWQLFEGDSSMYAEGPFYIIHGSIIDGLVRSGLTVRMGGPNEDMMTGWMMKAFNVSHYDDRRLCFKRTCDESLIAFQWDHAVRDFLDPEYRLSTICCEEGGVCQDESNRDKDGLTCMHKLHTNSSCAMPALNKDGVLPLFKGTSHKLGSDEAWIKNPV